VAESLVPIDYSSRDYASLRADLINAIPAYLPEWTSRSETDFGIVLIELFSYQADILSYYTDRIANEAFIATAVQRASVLSHAALIDYRPSGLAAANVSLTFTVSASSPNPTLLIPKGTQVATKAEFGQDPVVFETDADVTIARGAAGAVTATEGRTVAEIETAPVGVSDGSANQQYTLYYTDVIEGSLVLYVDEDGVGAQARRSWLFLNHLIDASADERAYSTFVNENGLVFILFGDNVNGRAPVTGSIITADYRVGVGVAGNVGANTLTEVVGTIVGLDSVTNPVGASGGADAESIESIRRKAPRSLTTLERAVTLSDYETLALKVAGVSLAKAVATTYTNVLLYIAPVGGGAPSVALQNAVLNYLTNRKMINASVTIGVPTYVPITVSINPLHVLPQYNRSAVETAVRNRVADLFAADRGDFGTRVTLSLVYRAITEVEGVDYAVLTALNSTGTGTLGDVVLNANEIPSVGTITVTSSGGLLGS
jgi:uncharacterized phage protein gp47/JayE